MALNENYFQGYNNLGLIYKKFEFFTKAEAAFKKSIIINSKFNQPYYNLMELYEKGNESEKLDNIIIDFEKYLIKTLYLSYIEVTSYIKKNFLQKL